MSEELRLKERLVTIEDVLGQVETDFSLTATQKYALRKNALLTEKAVLDQIIDDMRQRAALEDKLGPYKARQIRGESQGFEKQSAGINKQVGALGPDPNSFSQSWTAALVKMQSESQITWMKIADTFTSTVGNATKALADNFTEGHRAYRNMAPGAFEHREHHRLSHYPASLEHGH